MAGVTAWESCCWPHACAQRACWRGTPRGNDVDYQAGLFSTIQEAYQSHTAMLTEVDRHLSHAWQNFAGDHWGSTDTCWHFICVMFKKGNKARQISGDIFPMVLCELCVTRVIMKKRKDLRRPLLHQGGTGVDQSWTENISRLQSLQFSVSWQTLLLPAALCSRGPLASLSSSHGEKQQQPPSQCPLWPLRILGDSH